MKINNYMTPSEAAHRWGINTETLKNKLKPSLNKNEIMQMKKEGLIKSFIEPGKRNRSWIISVKAMEKWYGKEKIK